MPSVKAVLLTSLSCVSNWLDTTSHHIQSTALDFGGSFRRLQQHRHQAASEVVVIAVPPEFKSVLSSLPQETLHSVLHSHLPNFKDGVFEKDTKAVEEIYKRSPDMAKQLLAAARYDVLRRQNGNITTTSRPPITTTAPITLTQTDATGGTFLTTFTPVGGVYTSQVIQTSTLPDGRPTTYTSLTVVPAPTPSSTSAPRLQNDASPAFARTSSSTVTLTGVLMLALSFAGLVMV